MVGLFWWPPRVSNFMRSQAFWKIAKWGPGDVAKYVTVRHPLLGVSIVTFGYFYLFKWPLEQYEADRYTRFLNQFKASVIIQENQDWGNKTTKNEMKDFIASQIKKHGTFEAAVRAYQRESGRQVPEILVNDPILDETFRRVGIPVERDAEPSFLWDGTVYFGEKNKPMTFADGKVKIPDPPKFYNEQYYQRTHPNPTLPTMHQHIDC